MKKWIVICIGTLLLLPLNEAAAQKKEKEDMFEELTRDATYREGFIDSYQKDGHLYLALKPEMLEKNFLMKYEIAEGIGSSGLYGGTMLNIFEAELVAFEKHDGKIFFVKKPHRYTADEGSAERNAVNLTFSSSVLETAKIEAINDDSVMLVDAYGWFVSDLSNISRRVKNAVSSKPDSPGRVSFDKGKSYLGPVKAFPRNTNVTVKLTFKNAEEDAPRSVPDGRYIPVSIHYTLAQLPEQPMTPRYADDRVGFFMTVHKNFSDDEKTFFKRYVNKWRLECKEPAEEGELCEVQDPIVYYIDRTVPEKYRKPMMEGVEAWADAYEAAGFKDAIRARMLPEDADPEDIRYPTLRWNTSDNPGYGAIGPSIVDPRTGETLDADILFEANMLLGFKSSWRNLVDPSTAVQAVLGVNKDELKTVQKGAEYSGFAAHFSDQGLFLKTALIARGKMSAGEPVPDSYVHEALKWVTMHEVGHTLGLRHNFRSSTDTPLDKLYDKSWTRQNGVFSSVMEYPTPNVAPPGQENGYFYNPGVGSYDRWAISYGYTPDAGKAEEIARKGAAQGHAYGTDEDARGPGAIDPTVNVYDLSADPLAWGKQRATLAKGLMPSLTDYVMEDNMPYYELTNAYQMLLRQYAIALSTGIKYIGGQYQYRDHMGDPNERGPFVAVEKTKQKEALDFIIEYGFDEHAFDIPREVYQKFGADRWSHWGNSNTFDGRIDYPLHETIVSIQTSLLNQLTHPFRLARIRDAETKYGDENVVGIPEMMEALTWSIWSEAWTSPGKNISTHRRGLQRAYLNRMIELLIDAPSRTPADARAVIRYRLGDLHDRIESRLAPPAFDFDGYTLPHLEEAKARIEKALEAGLQLEN